MNDSFDDGSG
jgi:hypothetical protein